MKLKEIIINEPGCEVSKLNGEDLSCNISRIIWIGRGTGYLNGPNIRVSNSLKRLETQNSCATIEINDIPRILGDDINLTDLEYVKLTGWVLKNKAVLINYWQNNISAFDAIDALK